jgi:hypothetical protein
LVKTFIYLRNPVLSLRRPDGGIGRRAGLKNQWDFSLAGSIPAPGTNKALDFAYNQGLCFLDKYPISGRIHFRNRMFFILKCESEEYRQASPIIR